MQELGICEVVKEIELYTEFEDLPIIKGKILKQVEPQIMKPFHCRISHYSKPHSGAIDVYKPSSFLGHSSIKEAQISLIEHIREFKNIDVKKNEDF